MPDSSKSLIAVATLCLLIVCPALMAQDTPEVPEASPISNAKPTLAELMARFAEIESSYLPFHIDYSESLTQKLGPFLAGVTDDEPSYEYRAERGHRDLKVWLLETTIIHAGVSRTVRRVTNEAGHHLRETSPAPRFFDGDRVSESAEPQVRPLEGVFPLMFHTDAPILLSQHYAAEPKEFAFIWHDKLARVWCRHRSDNGLHVQVELWLDPDFAWHPVFMRRYLIQGEPLSVGERYADEWKVTEFRKLNELVRVSAGEFSGPIRRTTKTDESREAFVRSRFRILKSTYQTRVPDLVFSPETPIGGSPIAELEPVGGEQVEVKSTEIAELSLPLLTPEEIRELTAVTNRQSATDKPPAFSSNPSNRTGADENSPAKNRRLPAGSEEDELLKTYLLQNSDAQDTAKVIEQIFENRVTVAFDERTNSLIVRTQEALHQQIESLLIQLDEAPDRATQAGGATGSSSPDASNPPVPIAEYRRRLADLETPVMQLAEKVRAVETSLGKDHPDAVKQRAGLRALVQKTFAERQEIQRAELAEFTRRLQRMQQAIETREKIVDKIVDRRVEVLLNPDVDWRDSISTASTPDSTDDIDRPEANSDIKEVPPFHSQEPFSIAPPLEERPSVSGSVTDHQTQLRLCIEALVRDVDEFEDRTPLKLLMEFKDQPVLQITDDFKAAVSGLRKQVKLDAPRAKLEEGFAAVSQHGAAFVQAWGNVKSQPAKVVLNEIADDIVNLERCIKSLDQVERDGAKLNSALDPLAVKQNVAELEADKESVSLTLFEVSDAKFIPSDETNVRQTAAPLDLDDQLASMLKNKTAKLIGKHTIETTGNQLATLHSGGKFEVPSSSSEKKAEVVFGTTIEITPGTLNGERVFQIVWNERVRNFENDVSGIPSIDEKRIELNVTSPSPGGAGYLFGPLQGNVRNRRLFVNFLLNDASSDMPPVSRHDHSMENPLNDPKAALRPRLQGVTGETTADHSFFREEGEFPPKSDAEKSLGRLVLVFANDAARRMVPALMVKHGERTLALTVGPATIVPDDAPHAIDRTFLEFYNRDDVPTEYSQKLEFPDLRAYEAKESLTEFQLENPVTVELSDQLSAIINHGQADFKVTSRAARVTALEQSTTWELPSHNVTREFTGLVQIDQRLPEGTPLFKDGELAGITLLGTRFMKDDVPGSYVVPASRIFEVLRQVEAK